MDNYGSYLFSDLVCGTVSSNNQDGCVLVLDGLLRWSKCTTNHRVDFGVPLFLSSDYPTPSPMNLNLSPANPADNHLPLYAAFALSLAIRGVIDVVVWIINNKGEKERNGRRKTNLN